jgi:hypothetical protein
MSWCVLFKYSNPISVGKNNLIVKYGLYQNYPNPFNPVTNIKFDIPKSGFVNLKVYDMLGKEIAVLVNDNLTEGSYNVAWNASRFASGVYFYRIVADDFTDIKRMILLK